MTDPLRDYELKWSRTVHHANVLRESIKGFTDIDREAIRGEFDSHASQYFFRVPLERINTDWSLRLGEFVYDARACLNYLITALVQSTGEVEDNGNEFPIYGVRSDRFETVMTAAGWDADTDGSIRRKLNNTPTGTKAALKPLQPFYRGPAEDPFRHPLLALQVLSNTDKHRRLNVLNRVADIHFVDARRKPIYEQPGIPWRVAERYEGDAYTATLAVNDEFDMDVYLLPSYDVRLHEPPQLFGDVVEAVTAIEQFIDGRVLPAITGLL